jgi:hypothetical protein
MVQDDHAKPTASGGVAGLAVDLERAAGGAVPGEGLRVVAAVCSEGSDRSDRYAVWRRAASATRSPAGMMREGSSPASASGSPPVSLAITGVPQASASRTTRPNPSRATEGTTHTSAAWYRATNWVSLILPRKRTRPARPSALARSSRAARSGPSPASTSSAPSSRPPPSAQASSRTSKPIRGTRRRTATAAHARSSMSSVARACPRSPGTNRSSSTPGGTTSTFQGDTP